MLHVLCMQINKPHLPLASGQLSFTTAVFIAASLLIMVQYIDSIISTMIFVNMSFIHRLGGLLFYLFLQSFWLSLVIGSWPLIWNVVLTSSVWNVYSINVSSFQLHTNFFFPSKCWKHKYELVWINLYTCMRKNKISLSVR